MCVNFEELFSQFIYLLIHFSQLGPYRVKHRTHTHKHTHAHTHIQGKNGKRYNKLVRAA